MKSSSAPHRTAHTLTALRTCLMKRKKKSEKRMILGVFIDKKN